MSNIIINIKAFIAAVYLLFIGIAYPNVTPNVEYSTKITVESSVVANDHTEALPGNKKAYSITCVADCKNVGDPFKGKDCYNPTVVLYRGTEKNREWFSGESYNDAVVARDIPIKRGQEFSVSQSIYFDGECCVLEPGVYSVMVSVYGNTQYYENAVVIE